MMVKIINAWTIYPEHGTLHESLEIFCLVKEHIKYIVPPLSALV